MSQPSPSPANDPNRPMPSAHEMERAVLSCALQNADVVFSRLRWLTLDHFHVPAHACLWHEMTQMHDEGKPVDLTAMAQRLVDRGLLEQTGGIAFLAELSAMSAIPGHLDFYGDTIRDKHARRAGLAALWDAQTALWDESTPYSDALRAANEVIFDLQKKEGAKREFVQVKPLVFEAVEAIEAITKRRGHVTGGIATGFTDLDRRLMGTKPGQVIVVAGRPAMGKTAFMMNVAENIATGHGHYGEFDQQPLPTAVVSLEMGGAELMQRMLLSRAKVSLLRLRDGFNSKQDMASIGREAQSLSRSPLHILDTSGLDIISLASLLRQFVPANGIKVVCVDYLQLLKSTSRAAQSNRYVEVGEVSRGLKSIAKELGITLFVAAQIGRKAEERRDAIPRMSDLRESGDIENDADIIAMLHRPLYYASDKDKEDRNNDDLYTDGVNGRIEKATLIIGKHRGGPVGEVPLGWRGELARFESLRNKLNSNNPNEQE